MEPELTLDYADYVDAIRADGAALVDAARRAGIDAPVPSCPEWTVADLLGHIGRLHRGVASVIIDRALDRGDRWTVNEPPPIDERLDWVEAGVPMLADALAETGPGTAAWSWTNDKTSGFWARRQAHETAVHRYDAQLAAGDAQPIERALAADGVDEYFALIPFWQSAPQVRGNGETLHFHATDGDGEWLARLDPDGLVVTREHAKGDVAARGAASDLDLFVYGRVGIETLEVFGDASLLARWRELVNW